MARDRNPFPKKRRRNWPGKRRATAAERKSVVDEGNRRSTGTVSRVSARRFRRPQAPASTFAKPYFSTCPRYRASLPRDRSNGHRARFPAIAFRPSLTGRSISLAELRCSWSDRRAARKRQSGRLPISAPLPHHRWRSTWSSSRPSSLISIYSSGERTFLRSRSRSIVGQRPTVDTERRFFRDADRFLRSIVSYRELT